MLPVLICRVCHRDRRVRHCCVGPTELESEKKNVDQFWPKLLSANQKLGQKGTANQKLGEKGPANQKLGHWARLCQPIKNWARLGQIVSANQKLGQKVQHDAGPDLAQNDVALYKSQSFGPGWAQRHDALSGPI